MKRLRNFILSIVMISYLFAFIDVLAHDFAGNENYYKNLCVNTAISKENKEVCHQYLNYLSSKVSSAEDIANQYKGEIAKYKDDIAKQVEIANEYESKIDGFNSEINQLDAQILVLADNILQIENEIAEREEEIAEKDRIIIERMRKTQSDIRFGYEIDFLIKARDFATLIASTSVLTDILEFESIQIEEINKLIEQQKEAQNTLLLQQESIEISKQTIENKKAQIVVLKNEVDIAIANYKKLLNNVAALQSQAYADANALRKQMENINFDLENLPTSSGFVRPIAGGYISARVWYYPAPWSSFHIGYDYAAGVGTPVRAAANGVVISSSDGCATHGYLGNSCGGYAGNAVHLLVSVNNSLYGVMYFHLEKGSPIASGVSVVAGQTIGRLGSSGNSTGPHVHVEVIYLGERSISNYLNTWNGSLNHNIGMNLSNRCIDKGNTPPCRLDPGVVFGYN